MSETLRIEGSKYPHTIREVHIERLEHGLAKATGIVSGKLVSIMYSGEVASKYGITDAKPWLRDARNDLIRKYIDEYGDVPGRRALDDGDEARICRLYAEGVSAREIALEMNRPIGSIYTIVKRNGLKRRKKNSAPVNAETITPTIKVDSEFLDLLKAAGFDVIAGVVGLPYGVNVCITDLTQIDAINAIKAGVVKSEALKAKAEAEERAEIKRLFEELLDATKMA